MSSKIYLVRHGQTFFNIENRLGGNPGLTEKGFEHAEKVGKFLKDAELDVIYCSTLIRSMQTAEKVHKYHPDIPLIKKEKLREIRNGKMDGLTYAEFEGQYPEEFKERYKDKFNWKFLEGESYADVTERVKPLLDDLVLEGNNSAIVGHQSLNRTILGYLLDIPTEEISYLNTPNDVVYVIEPKIKKVSHIIDGELREGYVTK